MVRGERSLIEATAEQPPGWVVREPESDGQYHYFRGFRSDAPSLEGGETDARQNALTHIIQFLGLRVTVDYQRMRTEERTRIRDAIRSVGGADVFGTRLTELYYRRWRVQGAERVREAYDVYVLIRFPIEAVERIKQSQAERLQAIRSMIPATGIAVRPNSLHTRIVESAQALTALDELNQSVLITTETEGEAGRLAAQATSGLTRLIGQLQLAIATDKPKATSGDQDVPFTVTVNARTSDRGAPASVPNVPIAIAIGDSSRVIWTDDGGDARWVFHHIPFSIGMQPISAMIELPESLRSKPDFERSVPTADGAMEIVSASALEVLMVVVEERAGDLRQAERAGEARLVAALKEQGFQVISPSSLPPAAIKGDPWARESDAIALGRDVGATILLRGTVTTDDATPVARMQGVYFCRAQVQLTLTDLADRRLLGSVVLPDDVVKDTKGYGNSPERAAQDALSLDRSRRRQPNGFAHIAELVTRLIQ